MLVVVAVCMRGTAGSIVHIVRVCRGSFVENICACHVLSTNSFEKANLRTRRALYNMLSYSYCVEF